MEVGYLGDHRRWQKAELAEERHLVARDAVAR